MEVDHYAILGLPTGVAGSKLSPKDITKAYKIKALKLHPDKRRDDPNAHKKFQKLQNSYDILKDKSSRQVYDDRVRFEHEKVLRDFMRKKMMADLRKKEMEEKLVREEEERRRREMMEEMRRKQEIAERKARREERRKRRKIMAEMRMREELEEERRRLEMVEYLKRKEVAERQARDEIHKFLKDGQFGLDRGKVLKVSWDGIGEEYSVPRLRELFEVFGEVRYVLMRSCKINKGSAFIVMASKDAVVAATRSVVGYLDNPLLVLPVLRGGKYARSSVIRECMIELRQLAVSVKITSCESILWDGLSTVKQSNLGYHLCYESAGE
ncbi:J domain-containing protein [Heracleum sosnowskyi]|uniref:J domain-containing protein n=1 Tax=Heracleum sosnowskyi TaxID=360622 RepID=A0AAD8HMI9_9APIA|nr:J domain-containing protein [Heracleum sosnowskyi]